MPAELNIIVSVSIVGLLIVLGISARNNHEWRSFVAGAVALLAFAVLLNRLLGFPFSPNVSKGSQDLTFAVSLYICMVLGMLAQYVYRRFEKANHGQTPWDWGLFVAPIFASPIVFIPLWGAFQGADVKLEELTAPRIMIFCVAFQNGFFWKEIFDRQRKKTGK
jgi:hypothetical protein